MENVKNEPSSFRGKQPDWRFLILFLWIFLLFFIFPSHAGLLTYEDEGEIEIEKEITGFIPDGYTHYISHYWDYEDIYVVAFFRSAPTLATTLYPESGGKSYYHATATGGEKITFYDFYDEQSMLDYIYANDNSIAPENCRVRVDYESYVRLDPDSTIRYTNSDIVFSDTGIIYAASHPYSQTVTETVTTDLPYLVGGYTSSDLSEMVFVEILVVLGIVIPVIVLGIGLKKGISFFLARLKGV